jgi:hypothetical protein
MADRDRLAGELEALRELDKSTLSCGHNACFAKTDDGGKTGICTVCKVETLSARVRELESGAPAKPTDAP